MERSDLQERTSAFISGVWSERVLVITEDFEIKGFIFYPKTGKKNRVLSDILNNQKRFVAIKNCELKYRKSAVKAIENHEFIQLNLDSIIMIRPAFDGE